MLSASPACVTLPRDPQGSRQAPFPSPGSVDTGGAQNSGLSSHVLAFTVGDDLLLVCHC